jgi:hypothetical protein
MKDSRRTKSFVNDCFHITGISFWIKTKLKKYLLQIMPENILFYYEILLFSIRISNFPENLNTKH